MNTEFDHLRQVLGDNIRQRRRYQQLSQLHLAELAHTSAQTIWYIEHYRSNVSLKKISNIACALKCSAADLLKEDE